MTRCPTCNVKLNENHRLRCPLALAHNWRIVAILYSIGMTLQILVSHR